MKHNLFDTRKIKTTYMHSFAPFLVPTLKLIVSQTNLNEYIKLAHHPKKPLNIENYILKDYNCDSIKMINSKQYSKHQSLLDNNYYTIKTLRNLTHPPFSSHNTTPSSFTIRKPLHKNYNYLK